MKKVLLACFILVSINVIAQEKKSNIFLAAELNKTKGFSSVYSRLLPKTNLGIGVGIEFIDISTKQLGGIMPSLDVRYYGKFGRSTILPMAQVGYNFLDLSYTKPGTSTQYQTKGGPGFSVGLGYSYALNDKGSGPFAALKYRSLQYNNTDPLLPKTQSNNQLKISVGWRF